MASHLDGSDNHVVRHNQFLNNNLIHAVRPGYRVYCDIGAFVVFCYKYMYLNKQGVHRVRHTCSRILVSTCILGDTWDFLHEKHRKYTCS